MKRANVNQSLTLDLVDDSGNSTSIRPDLNTEKQRILLFFRMVFALELIYLQTGINKLINRPQHLLRVNVVIWNQNN